MVKSIIDDLRKYRSLLPENSIEDSHHVSNFHMLGKMLKKYDPKKAFEDLTKYCDSLTPNQSDSD